MIKKIVCILLIISLRADDLDRFIAKMEKLIDQFAFQIVNQFEDFSPRCSTLSYNQCEGTSELTCFQDLPTQQGCIGGGVRMSNQSAIKILYGQSTDTLTNEQKYVICSTAQLQSFFQSLNRDRNGEFLTAYLGSSTGMYRGYPTIKYNDQENQKYNCKNYDPRFRYWYCSSISGRKNMVFIIDATNSQQQYFQTVKLAAKTLIRTLGSLQRISILAIKSKTQKLTDSQMITLDSQSKKQQILQAIDKLSVNGSSDYKGAFEQAFSQLQKARNQEKLCCQKSGKNDVIFTFFTDGQSSEASDLQSSIKSYIDSQTNYNVQLFTYSFSTENSNQTYLSNLACYYNGRHTSLEQNQSERQIKNAIHKIMVTIAKGQNFQAVFSEFYIDAFGFGEMNSITKPVYYQKNSKYYLIGVASIDIPISTWLSFGLNIQEVKRRLKNHNQYHIQSQSCSDSDQTPDFPIISGQILAQIASTQTSKCCGLDTGGLIGLIVGIIILLVLICCTVFFICKYIRGADRKERYYIPPQNMLPFPGDQSELDNY